MRALGLLSIVMLVMTTVTAAAQSSNRPMLDWVTLNDMAWPRPPPDGVVYDSDLRDAIWSEVYFDGGVELYCRRLFTAEQAAARKLDGRQLTLEHAYPAELIARNMKLATRNCNTTSQGGTEERARCRTAVADRHNLWPAFQPMNDSRHNVPYGELRGEGTTDKRWISFCPDFERQRSPLPAVVEPTSSARGDLARSLLYMHYVYDLPLGPVVTNIDLLLVWNRDDPPDAAERQREDRIENVQPGRRNPLIPHVPR